MRPAARVQAAIDVVNDMQTRHRPASTALADWAKAHRFAGSGDRAAIGNLVYDTLRHKASAQHLMGAKTARAVVIGALKTAGGLSASEIAGLCDGSLHAPAALSPHETQCLNKPADHPQSAAVAAEVPDWIMPHLVAVFGVRAAVEGRALAERAPVDIRVNTLKTDRAAVQKAMAQHAPEATPHSRLGLRIRPPEGSKRHPNVEAELGHGQGWFEVQDEGSQIAAALTGAAPGQQILDLCAGAGGKSLALAAAMENTGRIIAYDDDKLRLRPIVERLARAGATCVEIISAGDTTRLKSLGAKFDAVLVDAPCSGSGTWRRKPDAKWRLKAASLAKRLVEQQVALETASRHVKPGGRLVYVTCSFIARENTEQISAFLAAHPDYAVVPTAEAWKMARPGTLSTQPPESADGRTDTLLLTPASHGTDGFYIAVLQRGAA